MVGIVEVQAWDSMEGDAFIKLRIGRTREDMDLMPEFLQGPAQVFDVDPLPPACGIASIGEETDPEGEFPRVLSNSGLGNVQYNSPAFPEISKSSRLHE